MQAAPAPAVTTQPPRLTWVHLRLVVSMVPPAPGRVFKLDLNPKRASLTVCGPAVVVAGIALGVVSQHPWFAPLAQLFHR